jgi:hypothetical protein
MLAQLYVTRSVDVMHITSRHPLNSAGLGNKTKQVSSKEMVQELLRMLDATLRQRHALAHWLKIPTQ